MIMKLLLVCLAISLSYASDPPVWNHLAARFPSFHDLPMDEDGAVKNGWTLISDNCKANVTGVSLGKSYMLNDEHATILIFDVNGRIAGFQMAYKTSLKEGSYGKYAGAYQKIGEYYYITAYFTAVENVCKKSLKRPQGIVGDKLILRIGDGKYLDVPKRQTDIKDPKWILGKCFPGMGIHYWYDISADMDCNDVAPFFILYNVKGHLVAWGYAIDVNMPGDRVEHPPWWMLWAFFQNKTKPKCLGNLKARSTQHVYFTKVGWFTHQCL